MLGAKVPLPAPKIVLPHNMVYSPQSAAVPTQNVVPVASVSGQPRPKPDKEELKKTWGKKKEEEEGVKAKEESANEAGVKGKDSLDDCLDEMENFLSELDEPEAKKKKEEEEEVVKDDFLTASATSGGRPAASSSRYHHKVS